MISQPTRTTFLPFLFFLSAEAFVTTNIIGFPSIQRSFSNDLPTSFSTPSNTASETGFSTTEEIEPMLPSLINHFMPEFELKSRVHRTIMDLSNQIPSLWSRPLSSDVETYTEDTRLVVLDNKPEAGIGNETLASKGNAIELISSRDELASLTNALVLAVQASSQATKFFNLLGANNADVPQQQNPQRMYDVQWKMAVNEESNIVLVDWSTEILPLSPTSALASSSFSTISGLSQLRLVDGKVSEHCLLITRWNGQVQDAASIGQSLSFVRQTVRGVQQTLGGSNSLFTQIGNELMQQLGPAADSPVASELSSLPFTMHSFDGEVKDHMDPSEWVEANESTESPIPGTSSWSMLETAYRQSSYFVEEMVPVLSSTQIVEVSQQYFSPKVGFYNLDKSLLLEGPSMVANLYNSLAAIRGPTLGSWELKRAKLLRWNASAIEVSIEYTTSTTLPGVTTSNIHGCDRYVIQVDSDDPPETPHLRIEAIYQESLVIAGNENKQDAVWAMRTTAAALKNGLGVVDDGFWPGLLNRLNGKKSSSSVEQTSRTQRRSKRAAATVYRVMETLHHDLAAIAAPESQTNQRMQPPAINYALDNLELRGYFDEILIRGKSLYNANIGISLMSFRRAIDSGLVVSTQDPKIRIELKANGDVRSDVKVYLKIQPLSLSGLPGVDLLPGFSSINENGIPITLGLVSSYILHPETGEIMQHRLEESRINGQLTPGDVVSRWINRQNGEEEQKEDNNLGWLRNLMDVLDTLN